MHMKCSLKENIPILSLQNSAMLFANQKVVIISEFMGAMMEFPRIFLGINLSSAVTAKRN